MKTYLCSYRFAGAEYIFEIHGKDMSEAQARLATLKAWAKLDGELMAKIPAVPGGGFLVRLVCWLRNTFGSAA
jgi:hypothetical protein